jgi:hypothetical protein
VEYELYDTAVTLSCSYTAYSLVAPASRGDGKLLTHESKGLPHNHTYSLYSAVETPRWGPASLTRSEIQGDDLPLKKTICVRKNLISVSLLLPTTCYSSFVTDFKSNNLLSNVQGPGTKVTHFRRSGMSAVHEVGFCFFSIVQMHCSDTMAL